MEDIFFEILKPRIAREIQENSGMGNEIYDMLKPRIEKEISLGISQGISQGFSQGIEKQKHEDEEIINKYASENAKYASENERLKAEIARLMKMQK